MFRRRGNVSDLERQVNKVELAHIIATRNYVQTSRLLTLAAEYHHET